MSRGGAKCGSLPKRRKEGEGRKCVDILGPVGKGGPARRGGAGGVALSSSCRERRRIRLKCSLKSWVEGQG